MQVLGILCACIDQSNNLTHQQAISSVLQSTPSMSNITAFMLSVSSASSKPGTCSVSVLVACMCHPDLQQERPGCPKEEQPCRCRHCLLHSGANACQIGRCPRVLGQACPLIEGSLILSTAQLRSILLESKWRLSFRLSQIRGCDYCWLVSCRRILQHAVKLSSTKPLAMASALVRACLLHATMPMCCCGQLNIQCACRCLLLSLAADSWQGSLCNASNGMQHQHGAQ